MNISAKTYNKAEGSSSNKNTDRNLLDLDYRLNML